MASDASSGMLEAVEERADPPHAGKLNLSCAGCGYGVVRLVPPERCPMCQAENAWVSASPRFNTSLQLTR